MLGSSPFPEKGAVIVDYFLDQNIRMLQRDHSHV